MAAGVRTVKIRFTGDSKGLDRATKHAESKLEKFGNKITKGIQSVTDKLPDLLSGVVGSLPPQGQAIALAITGGLAVALSAMIGAAITSAVLLAVGGGVLALGIKSAIDNPKVAKAFDGLKKKAAKVFDDFGKPFEAPLIRAATTFGKVLDDLKPHIDKLGRTIAPVIDKLAPALGEFLKQMMPGIQSAVEAAVPLFETLAEHLPDIGKAIGDFFKKISEQGPAANQFFDDLLTFIEGLIIVLGSAIAKLASWYTSIRDFLSKAKTRFAEFKVYALQQIGKLLDGAVAALGWIPGIGPKLKAAQGKFRSFQQNANAELKKIKDRDVRINVWSNVASVVANVGSQLAKINGGKVSGKRAAGGPVMSGRSYLVGEKGPEIVTMGSNGHVTPNHELGGGGEYYAIIDLGNDVKRTVKLEFQEQNRGLKRQVTARG